MQPAPANNPKEDTNQIELLPQNKGGRDVDAASIVPDVFKGIDAETAKYLDPSVVIDEETNRRVKKMVRESRLGYIMLEVHPVIKD